TGTDDGSVTLPQAHNRAGHCVSVCEWPISDAIRRPCLLKSREIVLCEIEKLQITCWPTRKRA
uniref:Thyroglobulin type-1 domain-containing protein n=1 Tax=Steinernema glaseri TaxID=37863 RepID=A0A1I8AFG1_9BILA